MKSLADELINASKSQEAFESWIDKRLSIAEPDSESLYQQIVDLKKRNVEDVFANIIVNEESSFRKLQNLFKQLDEEVNKDSQIRILCENPGGFVRGLSLMFVDPVVELALDRVSSFRIILFMYYELISFCHCPYYF